MKVLAVIDSLDPGGAERSLVDTLAAMPGVEAHIAVFRTSEQGFEGDARDAGIRLHHIEGGFARRARRLRSLVRHIDPDVVHSSLWNADLAARCALFGTEVPLVCSLVNDTYGEPRLASYRGRRRALVASFRAVDRITARRVDRFHAVTASVRAHYVQAIGLDPQRIEVAWRGRDVEALHPATDDERATARNRLAIQGPLVLALGRLEPQKSFTTLVDAMAEVVEDGATCIIAGRDGTDADKVRERIAERGLGDRVRLVGFRRDVASLFAAADCLVVSSAYEGTAGTVIEGMLAGVPVVATELPGIREVTADGVHARLVPAGEPTSLAAGITDVLQHDQSERIRGAREHAAACFALSSAADGLGRIYRAAIERRR